MCSHCKGQPHVHAAAVALHGGVEEALDLGEGDDLVEAAADLGPTHPQHRATQVNVLAAGQLRVEAGADFEQTPHAAAQPDVAGRRLGDAAEDFEQRRFARAVAADHADDLAGLDLERHVLERPEVVGARRELPAQPAEGPGGERGQVVAQGVVGDARRRPGHPVALRHPLDPDRRGHPLSPRE